VIDRIEKRLKPEMRSAAALLSLRRMLTNRTGFWKATMIQYRRSGSRKHSSHLKQNHIRWNGWTLTCPYTHPFVVWPVYTSALHTGFQSSIDTRDRRVGPVSIERIRWSGLCPGASRHHPSRRTPSWRASRLTSSYPTLNVFTMSPN